MSFTYHPRSVLVDSITPPIDGPDMPPFSQLDMGAIIHYTADDDLIDGDPGEHYDQLDDYLRAIQRSYLRRGYSFGYNWAVDWLGGIWQARGWDFRNAANVGRKWQEQHGGGNVNHRTFSILVLVDGQDPMTAEALKSCQAIIAEGRAKGAGKGIHSHSYVEWTQCCGDGIRAQVGSGQLEPGTSTPPPTKPPPTDDTLRTSATVISGDGWYSIARRVFVDGTSNGNPKALATANGDKALYAGDKVKVPGKVVRSDWVTLFYTVVKGDSYYAISRKVYVDGDKNGNPQALQTANRNKALHPGDTIVVPGKAQR